MLPVTLTEEEKLAPEVTVKLDPTATLPEVVKVDNVVAPRLVTPAFNPPKLDNPVTFNPFNAPYPVMDPPTPTLPVVVKEVELMFVAFNADRLVSPKTLREDSRLTPDVTVREEPNPTLPEVFKVFS